MLNPIPGKPLSPGKPASPLSPLSFHKLFQKIEYQFHLNNFTWQSIWKTLSTSFAFFTFHSNLKKCKGLRLNSKMFKFLSTYSVFASVTFSTSLADWTWVTCRSSRANGSSFSIISRLTWKRILVNLINK